MNQELLQKLIGEMLISEISGELSSIVSVEEYNEDALVIDNNGRQYSLSAIIKNELLYSKKLRETLKEELVINKQEVDDIEEDDIEGEEFESFDIEEPEN